MNHIRKIFTKVQQYPGSTRFIHGFTLIELLVVIAIIGILSSIVLASLSGARSKSGDAQVEEEMTSLRNAAEIYFNTYAAYNTSTAFTGGGSGNDTTCSVGTSPTTGVITTTFLNDTTSGASSIIKAIAAPTSVTSIQCAVSNTGYVVVANLPSNPATNPFWCIDSSGHSKAEPTVSSFTGYVCN